MDFFRAWLWIYLLDMSDSVRNQIIPNDFDNNLLQNRSSWLTMGSFRMELMCMVQTETDSDEYWKRNKWVQTELWTGTTDRNKQIAEKQMHFVSRAGLLITVFTAGINIGIISLNFSATSSVSFRLLASYIALLSRWAISLRVSWHSLLAWNLRRVSYATAKECQCCNRSHSYSTGVRLEERGL